VRGMTLNALAALAGLALVVTAVAVAAGSQIGHGKGPGGIGAAKGPGPRSDSAKLPLPRITRHPAPVDTSATASFRFRAAGITTFRCRLDIGRWRSCTSRVAYSGLVSGRHSFAVRATASGGRERGPIRTYRWLRAEPKPFSIEFGAELETLFPGAPPTPLPLRVENPNALPIYVTGLSVSIPQDPPECDAATNFALEPSTASVEKPLLVPAGGVAAVPSQGVQPPTIALRDLPVNQDACQNARIPLNFSGSSHG
jgi:hypothetical protein